MGRNSIHPITNAVKAVLQPLGMPGLLSKTRISCRSHPSAEPQRAMTAILGISAFYHDSAASLIVDGDIVAAAQEERFTRKKHDAGFPSRAVEYCLREARLDASRLDYVVFYEKPVRKLERLLETYVSFAPAGFKSFSMALPVWLKEKTRLPAVIREGLGATTTAPIVFTDHHESHAASAFFPSPFEEA